MNGLNWISIFLLELYEPKSEFLTLWPKEKLEQVLCMAVLGV